MICVTTPTFRYNITELVRGTKYYVRVSALNTLGYGESADYEDAVPITSPDAPGFPTTIAQLGEETTGKMNTPPLCEQRTHRTDHHLDHLHSDIEQITV